MSTSARISEKAVTLPTWVVVSVMIPLIVGCIGAAGWASTVRGEIADMAEANEARQVEIAAVRSELKEALSDMKRDLKMDSKEIRTELGRTQLGIARVCAKLGVDQCL